MTTAELIAEWNRVRRCPSGSDKIINLIRAGDALAAAMAETKLELSEANTEYENIVAALPPSPLDDATSCVADLVRTNQQNADNATWLIGIIDGLHGYLHIDASGTWQDRVKQVVERVHSGSAALAGSVSEEEIRKLTQTWRDAGQVALLNATKAETWEAAENHRGRSETFRTCADSIDELFADRKRP